MQDGAALNANRALATSDLCLFTFYSLIVPMSHLNLHGTIELRQFPICSQQFPVGVHVFPSARTAGAHRRHCRRFHLPLRPCRPAQDRRQNEPGQFDFYLGAVLVAILLRGGGTLAGPGARAAMQRAAVLLRGACAVSAIRTRLPVLLPGAGAAARPCQRWQHVRPDAESAVNLP